MSRNINLELFSAVRSGNLEDTRNLIDSFGLAYSKAWSNGYVLLRDAIEEHKTEIAKLLLTKGAKVNSLNNETDTPLHFASINGDIEIIEMLLDRNANINAFNKNGETPLHYAICSHMEVCELLLNRNADINAANENGNTPLHYAIETEQMIIIDLLLNRGASVNARDNSGKTSLHCAIYVGYGYANTNTKLIALLLSKGADINDNAEFNLTPLHVAIKKGDETIVKLLLEHGANVDAQDKNGQTILNLAVEKGNRCIVEHILKFSPDVNDECNRKCLHAAIYESGNKEILYKLLEYGFGVESEDINNCKLLFCAVKGGYLVIVDILLKNGADVNMLYKFEVGIVYTLLHCATNFNQAKVVELLLSYGADVNAKDEKGETPIDYAARDNNSIIGKLLLTNKANVKNSSNALSIAVKRNKVKFVEMLLNVSQIDIDAAIENGKTALHFTAEYYSIDTALLLLNRGANVNATDESGHTALHYAICKNNDKLVQILLEYNADVNCQVEGGATPLHFAAERGNEEICEMLLNKGAKINQENNGRTALHIAVEKRRLYIVKMLLQHGAEIKQDMMSIHIAAEQGFACIIENLLIKFGVDVDCRDEHNRTALHIASEQDDYGVVGLLLKYGADINAMDEWKKTPLDYARCNLNNDLFTRVYKWSSRRSILQKAILMRNAANLYVSKKNFQKVDISRFNDFYCECLKEVENLRREKICKYVSFYDIVTKGASQLAIYARNKNIVQVLNFVNYRKKFPMYADMIENNFKIGQMRQCLLNFAAKSLDLLSRHQLPDHVTAQMCSYFSKIDLENLIDACPDNVAFRKTIAMDRLKIYSRNDREANLKKCFYWLFREKLPALLIEQIFGYLSYNDIINLLEACPSYTL